MKASIFFSKYSKLPISDRFVVLSFNSLGLNLYQIYKRLSELDNLILPLQIEKDDLLREAEKGFKDLDKSKQE